MTQIVDEYRQWLEAWASAKTVSARTIAAANFLTDCGGLDGITPQSIGAFIAKPRRDGKPKSTWSKATYHGHLKSLCEFLVAAGYLDSDPIEGVRSVKRPNKAPRPLSELDVERVLRRAEGDVRDWIVIALATGMRVSEIARLRGEDVTSHGIYVDGKGDVGTSLPAHPDLLEMAERMPQAGYWWTGSEDGHVPSQQISKKVGVLFRTLGIKGSIHRCRHTYGTRLIRNGTNVRIVQKLMRHASLETTAGYTAVGEDEMHRAVLLLPTSHYDEPPPTAA